MKRRRGVLFHGFTGARPGPAARGYRRGVAPYYSAGARRSRIGRNARIGGFEGIEHKFFDTEVSADAFTTLWASMEPATTNLTAMSQGDGESQRDGRKLSIDQIHVQGFVELPGGETTTDPPDGVVVRICLVLDTQTNGTTIVGTDVMVGGKTNDCFGFQRLDNSKRFRVLWNKIITINEPALSHIAANLFSTCDQVRHFKKTINFNPPLQVNMSSTTANITNVKDNSIHMIGVSTPFNAAIVPRLSYQCRVRFKG